jgi:hypothetical protein
LVDRYQSVVNVFSPIVAVNERDAGLPGCRAERWRRSFGGSRLEKLGLEQESRSRQLNKPSAR